MSDGETWDVWDPLAPPDGVADDELVARQEAEDEPRIDTDWDDVDG